MFYPETWVKSFFQQKVTICFTHLLNRKLVNTHKNCEVIYFAECLKEFNFDVEFYRENCKICRFTCLFLGRNFK